MKNKTFYSLTIAILFIAFSACKTSDEMEALNNEIEDFLDETVDRSKFPDSLEVSHGDTLKPDYSTEFNHDDALRLHISIDSNNLQNNADLDTAIDLQKTQVKRRNKAVKSY